jgi:cystathionine beta-lyase/cystathionine gamma-synthase
MGAAAFNSSELYDRLSFLQNAIGAVPSPFDCWLAHRGLKTLHLRAREATKNATGVAEALEASPNVISVNYPGLASHAQRAIAIKQHRNGMGGGMLSFRIRGGHEAAERFCQATKIFTLAESLGGIESLVEVPSAMTHTWASPRNSVRRRVCLTTLSASAAVSRTRPTSLLMSCKRWRSRLAVQKLRTVTHLRQQPHKNVALCFHEGITNTHTHTSL